MYSFILPQLLNVFKQWLSSAQNIHRSGLHCKHLHDCKIVTIQDSYTLLFKHYKIQFWILLFSSNFLFFFLSEMPLKYLRKNKQDFFFPSKKGKKSERDSTNSFWKQSNFCKVRAILMTRKQPDQKLWIQILQKKSDFASVEARNFYLDWELLGSQCYGQKVGRRSVSPLFSSSFSLFLA